MMIAIALARQEFNSGYGVIPETSTLAKGKPMLHYSLVFLVVALIAAFLGFGGLAGAAAGIAKILFFVFLVVWLVTFLLGRKSTL